MFKSIIGFALFGTLFALLFLSYIISERGKKKSATNQQPSETSDVDKKEPSIGNVKTIPTTQEKINISNKKLNQVLRNKTKDEKMADEWRVLHDKMSQDEYDEKWGLKIVNRR